MNLFRDGKRSHTDNRRPGQPRFRWLDESAKPGADTARDDLQRLFDQYPSKGKAALANRIQSDGPDHDAASAP
jgi:hypothetical protein